MSWRGKLSVRVDAVQPQSFSAGFELSGDAQTGELILYTPIGSTAALLSWSPNDASLRANGDIQRFPSLGDLLSHAVGTDLPVRALFGWLAGENQATNGWVVDLSQRSSGRITARRIAPVPAAELRLVLEK